MNRIKLDDKSKVIFNNGGVFVPSPLALNVDKKMDEAYQRLLTLYYIKAGAKAVIPGAHTGEFALYSIEVLDKWQKLIKEVYNQYGDELILMSMVGGEEAIKQAEVSAENGYQAVMIAPTAFAGKNHDEVIELFRTIASIIPTFAFELQKAIPGSYKYTLELWTEIFKIVYGAKGASFNTYQTLVMLEAAAKSNDPDSITLLTGNDDRIVADLLGEYSFTSNGNKSNVNYNGGLLGHFATDTNAAVNWVKQIQNKKKTGTWSFNITEEELAHGVNRCNMALFDALGNFENSIWGVKHRLTSLGLLPGSFCMHENGRKGQAESIDAVYNEYAGLSDIEFIAVNIDNMKREIGIEL